MPTLIDLLSFTIDLLKWRRLVSSVKSWTLQNNIDWYKSLMYIENKSTLRTEPWGTLYKTDTTFELWLFIEMYCVSLDNKTKHLSVMPQTPQSASFANKILSSAMSKAFCRSTKIM